MFSHLQCGLSEFDPPTLTWRYLVNLGKWVLRYLFANLVDEEIRRDEVYRTRLPTTSHQMNGFYRDGAPPLIQLPLHRKPDLDKDREDSESVITPRAVNGHYPAATPGLGIGIATPGTVLANHNPIVQNHLPSTIEEGSTLEKRKSLSGNPRTSGDYFSSNPTPHLSQSMNGRVSDSSSAEAHLETVPQSPGEPEKDTKTGSIFGKKFRMSFPKKLGRSSAEAKPSAVDDKSEASDRSSEKEDKVFEDNFTGSLQKIRQEYDEQLQHPMAGPILSGINPSLPHETPLLKPPSHTTVIIQEDRPESGGVADLYQGTVRSVGEDADLIEKAAPLWLGDLLLRVKSSKSPNKHTEIPLTRSVESNPTEGNSEDILRSPTISRPPSSDPQRGRVCRFSRLGKRECHRSY